MKAVPALLLVLLFLGCGDGGNYEGSDMDRTESSPGEGAPPTAARAPEAVPDRTAIPDGPADPSGATADTAGGSGAVPAAVMQRQIIRTGTIAITVESLDSAERTLARTVTALGGYTANSSRTRVSGNTLTGTIETRVPSPKFEALLDAVRRMGRVESENISASDVTQEYIDLQARLKGQQQLEERLLKLLAERPGKLADIVEIEQKLADVRSVIEGIQGRLRYLRNQVDYSTLTVTMTEPGAVGTSETETFGGRIADAFEQGIDGLVGLLAGLITLLMVLLPFALVAIVAYLIYRAWRRRHPAKPRGTPPEKV